MFPMDIWRHMLMWRDQELNYRISNLSKVLYQLAQPYRLQVLKAYQVKPERDIPLRQSSPQLTRIFDNVMCQQQLSPLSKYITYELVPCNEFLSTNRTFEDIVSSKDMAWIRKLSFYPTTGKFMWEITKISGIFVHVLFYGPWLPDYVMYELFDRKYIAYSDHIETKDRYNLIIMTDKYFSDSDGVEQPVEADTESLKNYFSHILHLNPNCKISWNAEKHSVILTFDL